VTVDPRAATGFANVGAYERARPSYPAEALNDLAREFGLKPTSTVLDLAAGTGKLTRLLLPHAGRVIAVEPSEAMLAVLRAQLPAVEARRATAEAIPCPDASVDAVFVGQAFHWFRAAQAGREIARVLRSRGGLALLWNRARWTDAEVPWRERLHALTEPYREAAGGFPGDEGRWEAALEELGLFVPLGRAEVEHVHRIASEDIPTLVASWSWIENLPDEERAGVLRRVAELVGTGRELALTYRTEIYWTRKNS
jgi:SAM-dependent methyltransferase